jgi:hypothetical protein
MAAHMDPVELAWKLADSVDEYLLTLERHRVYVALGSGDTGRAIIDLISVAARERIRLPRMVIAGLQLWHTAHDDLDAHLGRVISSIPIAPEQQSPAADKKITYVPTTRGYRRTESNRPADGST